MSLFINLAAADEAASDLRSAAVEGGSSTGLVGMVRGAVTSFVVPANVSAAHVTVEQCRRGFRTNVEAIADGIDRAAQVTRVADVLHH